MEKAKKPFRFNQQNALVALVHHLRWDVEKAESYFKIPAERRKMYRALYAAMLPLERHLRVGMSIPEAIAHGIRCMFNSQCQDEMQAEALMAIQVFRLEEQVDRYLKDHQHETGRFVFQMDGVTLLIQIYLKEPCISKSGNYGFKFFTYEVRRHNLLEFPDGVQEFISEERFNLARQSSTAVDDGRSPTAAQPSGIDLSTLEAALKSALKEVSLSVDVVVKMHPLTLQITRADE